MPYVVVVPCHSNSSWISIMNLFISSTSLLQHTLPSFSAYYICHHCLIIIAYHHHFIQRQYRVWSISIPWYLLTPWKQPGRPQQQRQQRWRFQVEVGWDEICIFPSRHIFILPAISFFKLSVSFFPPKPSRMHRPISIAKKYTTC